ncbi:DNA sulfur modification protein DndD [Paenibacillus sp.]|uniref:DNA sulfur modification protein DndD n=1 Tax=Paenibacillus sp. TaxID=58172 RepID=UPI002D4549A1|nr:DNA sulfur modification protein DndD [Paenibacillus sp.]HZG86243.1 DNA sulfur modification protein DndD [Paenibacillus sp.]
MKFIRLRLINIGAFHGNYDFDLRTESSQRNVVLFGGKNGAGKTTILESVKLALFGPLAYGYKTESIPYFEKIQSKLNNVARKNKEQRFQIILDVEIVEDFQKNHYTLLRSWTPTKNSLKEDFTVLRNRVELSILERELFQNKLRENTPPQLMDLCLFDGEKISQVISDEVLSDYLKESSKVMFNLDLFEHLESDLASYLKLENIQNTLTADQQEVIELNSRFETLQSQKMNLVSDIERIEQELEDNHDIYKDLVRNYETHGGLLKDQREALLREQNEIELNRKLMMESTRETLSSLLPFALVKQQLTDIAKQMQNEIKYELVENVDTLFHPDGLQHILNQMQRRGSISLQQAQEAASQLRDEMVAYLSNQLPAPIHRASFEQRSEIQSMIVQLQNFDSQALKESFKKNADLIKQSQQIRKKLSENDETSELHDLLNKISTTQSTITLLEHEIEQKKVIQAELEEEIQRVNHLLLTAKEKQIRNKKNENIFSISTRVAEVSKHFRKIQLTKKLQEVEIETVKMLRLLFRKELFVVRIWIHPETFQLKLYNAQNEEISKDILSAGEKQILLLSTMWAMAKSANRRLPFIFDTLLGRLDQTHKKSIIQHFIPKCGEQVIILSTDSEIDEEHYNLIYPIVAKNYLLDYSTEDSTVHVFDQYFQFSR